MPAGKYTLPKHASAPSLVATHYFSKERSLAKTRGAYKAKLKNTTRAKPPEYKIPKSKLASLKYPLAAAVVGGSTAALTSKLRDPEEAELNAPAAAAGAAGGAYIGHHLNKQEALTGKVLNSMKELVPPTERLVTEVGGEVVDDVVKHTGALVGDAADLAKYTNRLGLAAPAAVLGLGMLAGLALVKKEDRSEGPVYHGYNPNQYTAPQNIQHAPDPVAQPVASENELLAQLRRSTGTSVMKSASATQLPLPKGPRKTPSIKNAMTAPNQKTGLVPETNLSFDEVVGTSDMDN